MCGKNNVIVLSSAKGNKMGSKSKKNVYRYNHDWKVRLDKNCVAQGFGKTEILDLKLINLTLIQVMPDDR